MNEQIELAPEEPEWLPADADAPEYDAERDDEAAEQFLQSLRDGGVIE